MEKFKKVIVIEAIEKRNKKEIEEKIERDWREKCEELKEKMN